MDLFLTHHCGPGTRGYPGDQLQASNAAELYRWAVRPSADTQRAYTVLVELLPRIGFGPERVGRAAVCQILEGEGGPGLVEPVWLALLDAARAAPPHQPAPMEPPPSGRTPTPALVHEPPRQLGPHRMPTAPQTQPLPPAPQAAWRPAIPLHRRGCHAERRSVVRHAERGRLGGLDRSSGDSADLQGRPVISHEPPGGYQATPHGVVNTTAASTAADPASAPLAHLTDRQSIQRRSSGPDLRKQAHHSCPEPPKTQSHSPAKFHTETQESPPTCWKSRPTSFLFEQFTR